VQRPDTGNRHTHPATTRRSESVCPSLTSLAHAQLVVAVHGDVAHPRQRLVARLLYDLQVTHLQPRHSEVWNLELHLDGGTPVLRVLARDGGQAEVCTHQVLLGAGELLDGPDDGVAVGEVGDGTDGGLEGRRVHVLRHGNDDLHIVGNRATLELGLGFNHVLDAGVAVGLHDRLHPYQRLHVCIQAVGHQLKLAIGGDEGDGTVVLESGQTNALMEFDVFKLHCLHARGGSASGFKHELVVEAKLELRHAREEGLHLDTADDLGVKHGAIAGHQQV
jgi:hypothetical protein